MTAEEIAKLFPNLFGQPSAMLKSATTSGAAADQSLIIGVVLSGGQAPGGHNVISGIFGKITMFKLISNINLYPLFKVMLHFFERLLTTTHERKHFVWI